MFAAVLHLQHFKIMMLFSVIQTQHHYDDLQTKQKCPYNEVKILGENINNFLLL